MSNSLRPSELYILQNSLGHNLEWVAFPLSRWSSQSRCPAMQADSLPAEPQGKPKNTGVGSLFLLQCIFPSQESNQGLLHCRPILYLLSDQEFTRKLIKTSFKASHFQGQFFGRTLQCIHTIVYFSYDQWGLLFSLWFHLLLGGFGIYWHAGSHTAWKVSRGIVLFV